MGIKYEQAEDIRKKATEIVQALSWNHISLDDLAFLRSRGSTSRGTIARCHALGKAMQIGMNRKKGFYLIEVISERFDRLSEEDKVKTVIHELMHIPKTFGGGFIHHNVVHQRNVDKVFQHYLKLKMDKRWEDRKEESAELDIQNKDEIIEPRKKIWEIQEEIKKKRRWF